MQRWCSSGLWCSVGAAVVQQRLFLGAALVQQWCFLVQRWCSSGAAVLVAWCSAGAAVVVFGAALVQQWCSSACRLVVDSLRMAMSSGGLKHRLRRARGRVSFSGRSVIPQSLLIQR